MNHSPIYIVENQVYRFEQVIDNCIELFNGFTDTSVMVSTNNRDEIETELNRGHYTITQY